MAQLERITVGLPAGQIAMMRQAIDSGRFETEDDLVAEALLEWHVRNMPVADSAALRVGALWDEGKAGGETAPYDLADVLEQVQRRDSQRG